MIGIPRQDVQRGELDRQHLPHPTDVRAAPGPGDRRLNASSGNAGRCRAGRHTAATSDGNSLAIRFHVIPHLRRAPLRAVWRARLSRWRIRSGPGSAAARSPRPPAYNSRGSARVCSRAGACRLWSTAVYKAFVSNRCILLPPKPQRVNRYVLPCRAPRCRRPPRARPPARTTSAHTADGCWAGAANAAPEPGSDQAPLAPWPSK
jgi:hypothetical protein